jgi:isopenicillin N synthase-like dioxygenase
MTTGTAVPVVDLAPLLSGNPEGKRRVAQSVGAACTEIGFFTLTGHGVPETLIARVDAAARAFFDLPAEVKARVKLTAGGAGYSPLQGEALAATRGEATPADLKESFNAGADFEANVWPPEPAVLRPAITEYFQAMTRLAEDLMRAFALALSLPEHYFADKIDRPQSFLRVINYPPPATEPLPGQLRAGAHSDYGTLTILRSENVAGGLQVRSRAGQWLDVVAPAGAYVINIGDMLMRWTNDRWVSTLHRVVNPPAAQAGRSRRQSLVFFHNPNADTLIQCLPTCASPENPPRYEPVRAGEYLAEKARRAYRTKDEG